MGTLTEFTAENGTHGTALTTGNTGASQVTTTSGSTATFDSGAAMRGSLGYRFVATSGGQTLMRQSAAVSNLAMAIRFYFKIDAFPSTGKRIITTVRSASSTAMYVYATSAGKIELADRSFVNLLTSTETFTAGQFYRVELVLNAGTTTSNGTVQANYYAGHSTTPLNGSPYTSSVYNMNAAAIAAADIGSNDTGSTTITLSIDDFAFLDGATAEIGPSLLQTTLSPSGIAAAQAFGTPAVTSLITASPAGIAGAESLGSPALTSPATVSPSGITGTGSVGAPAVTAAATASPSGVAGGEAVGTPAVSAALAAAPGTIGPGSALGQPAATASLTASPAGIASAESFGTPSAAATVPSVVLSPAGIGTGETFGTAAVAGVLQVTAGTIASGQAFGTPTAGGLLATAPGTIASAEAFGVLTAAVQVIVSPSALTLVDSFITLTPAWTVSGGAAVSGGQASLPATSGYPALRSVSSYDLTGAQVAVRVVAVPNASNGSTQGIMELARDPDNFVQFVWENGLLFFRERAAGIYSDTSVPYSPGDHRWWRITESAGTVRWETSADNIAWVTLRSRAQAFALTNLYVAFYGGNYNAAPTPGTFVIDDANMLPPFFAGTIADGADFGVPVLTLNIPPARGHAAGHLAAQRHTHSATSPRWEGLLG